MARLDMGNNHLSPSLLFLPESPWQQIRTSITSQQEYR